MSAKVEALSAEELLKTKREVSLLMSGKDSSVAKRLFLVLSLLPYFLAWLSSHQL